MRRNSAPAVILAAMIALASLPADAQQRPAPPAPGQMAPGPGAQRPQAAPAQPQGQPQAQQQQAPAPVKPYRPVAVAMAAPSSDPSFAAFRKQLADIAQKKDRAALAKLVARDFFWEGEAGNMADKKKSAIDNLGAALGGFSGPDAGAWETLTAAAGEATLEPFGDRKNVMCSPAGPQIDEQAFEALAKETGTDVDEWAFPTGTGLEVRAAGQASAPVVEKLGMHLVRVLPDEPSTSGAPADAPPFVRVATPSGRTGFVPLDALAALISDQICYVKDATGWKIAGFLGGV